MRQITAPLLIGLAAVSAACARPTPGAPSSTPLLVDTTYSTPEVALLMQLVRRVSSLVERPTVACVGTDPARDGSEAVPMALIRPETLLDLPDAVITELRRSEPQVRPWSACYMDVGTRVIEGRRGDLVPRERSTDSVAVLLWVRKVSASDDSTGTGRVGFRQFGTNAGEWLCQVRRRDGRWYAGTCEVSGEP